MFIMMSWARVRRSALGVEQSAYSLRKAYIAQADAQRDLTETMREYGVRSKEYRDAQLNIEEAAWRVKMAEEAVRGAAEQSAYAWAMLAFGSLPTYLRAAFDVTSSLMQIFIAKQMVTGASYQEAAAHVAAGGGMTISLPIIGTVTIAYWKLAAAVGAATFGLSILTGVLAQQYAQRQAEAAMKSAREEAKKYADELYYGGSVTTAVQKVAEIHKKSIRPIREFSEELTNVERGALGEELSTRITGIGAPMAAIAENRGLTLIINHPIVREAEDIYRITRDVERAITKASWSRRGRY